ncbi:MAG: hypothetical protein QG635_1017 [Bacteroidota bacterium]|nr:hypothetical protein [Bacteroidota bacterium]
MDNQKKYNILNSRLRATRRSEAWGMIFSSVLNTIGATALSALFAAYLETALHGDEAFRGTLAAFTLIAFLTSIGVFFYPVFLKIFGHRKQSLEQIALRIGGVYPDIRDRLCNAVQLMGNFGNPRGTSQDLTNAAFEQVYDSTKDKNFRKIIKHSNIKYSLLFFLISAIFVIVSLGLSRNALGSAFYRLANFNKSFLPPAPFALSIEPLNIGMLRGDKAVIKITATGKAPETIELNIKEQQQENYDVYKLKLESGNVYSYTILSLKQSIIFFAKANWLSSSIITEIGRIKIIDRPLVRSISGRLIYPSYTELEPKDFTEQNADITALKGTVAEFQIVANKDLSKAFICFERLGTAADSLNLSQDTLKVLLKTDGRKAYGNFPIKESGVYYFSIYDKDGQHNIEPIKYGIAAMSDAYPTIALLDPNVNVQLDKNALLPMKISISDDYGFSYLKLYYRLASSRYSQPDNNFTSVNIPILNKENSAEVPYLWNLHNLGISPEDIFEFYVEVADNDKITGPKTARTGSLAVRLPSLKEVIEDAEGVQDKIEQDLQQTLKKAEEASKDMEDLNRELMKQQDNKKLDWKEKKKMEDILKKQAEVQQKFGDIQKQLEDVTKNLQDNNALSPETIQKYMELQKLMTEVKSPELERMQKKMEQALDQLTADQLQKMMKEAQFNEEQFRKSIERTINILKRLKAEQKIDALAKRAEEMAKQQDDLQKQLENSNQNDPAKQDELAKQQKNLLGDFNDMKKELEELEKMMKEIGKDMPLDELAQAKQELNPSETMNEMQKASSSCKNGDFNKAKQSQKKASKNLKDFASNMKKLKEGMEKSSKKEAIRQMQKSITDMLKLSKDQEDLKQKTASADYNSTQIPDYAEQQSEIYGSMVNVINGLMKLAQKSFSVTPEMGEQLGNSLKNMQKSIEQLADRRASQSAKFQSQAQSSMNSAISQMQQSLSSMQKQGSGSCNNPGGTGEGEGSGGSQSVSERLQRLAAQQQGINSALQQQMGQSGGKLTQEQQGELGRLASEQGRAQKSLEDLAKEQKQNTDGNKITGDLKKISEEMKEVMTDMQNGNINQETLNRQERILSRLLDATRSMNDRDYQKKRESKAGKDVVRPSPGQLDMKTQEGRTRAMQDMMRSIQEGYTKDYEVLIQKYFEALGNGNN